MATIKRFEDLEIWKEARRFSFEVYKLTCEPPFATDFRFRDQIRAAAGSVMDNIAEGFERSGRLEVVNFLDFAKGSAGEVRSQLHRAFDQTYINEATYQAKIEEYEKLSASIAGFISYLNRSEIEGQKFKDRR
ncbi:MULTISPECIES: four helix bundle protein [unclassified Imperialibacter]|uniref:four helix bundle protein n=1 Tax=unclassified Imperialibacter TaxID=2629706 RepID=UPI00125821FD|nr:MULTISPECIES: four helix bundle protein [unclassified Imperialibacter]CAD5250783.1 30S ribosomal protein S23 [Imperialibacter sp. 75]CAD5285780.1 30S ribosomal protein S23 [Imperialibacter sp. 89]VVT04976.1 30S ribosomal protein S23 [Imperialibacter sp. EC-SDR9]